MRVGRRAFLLLLEYPVLLRALLQDLEMSVAIASLGEWVVGRAHLEQDYTSREDVPSHAVDRLFVQVLRRLITLSTGDSPSRRRLIHIIRQTEVYYLDGACAHEHILTLEISVRQADCCMQII